MGEESACNAGDLGSIPGLGTSPGVGNGNSLQYSGMENSMDRGRSLAGYRPWGHKELDTTERQHIAQYNMLLFTKLHLTLRPHGQYLGSSVHGISQVGNLK